MSYYIAKTLDINFNGAIERVTDELKKEGFGVISEINNQDKLKEKLNIDFRKYMILGACNPSYAYEALQKEDKIGTMLPCNIIVQEHSQNVTEVAVIDPVASMQAVNNPSLAELGNKIRNKLEKVIEAL